MSGRDANQLAADMEETLRRISAWIPPTSRDAAAGLFEDARAALDALVARITDLEAQVEEQSTAAMDNYNWGAGHCERADAAEAQVAALTQERAALIANIPFQREKLEAAEAALATTRQALEDIAYTTPANNAQGTLNIFRERAALALLALERAGTGGDTKEPA